MIHSERARAWGAFAVLIAALSTLPGCQDGYPIEPTPCDRYCALGTLSSCADFNPTACVVSCEGTTFSHICPTEFDGWVDCSRDHQRHLECGYSVVGKTDDCEEEHRALAACAAAHGFPTSGAE